MATTSRRRWRVGDVGDDWDEELYFAVSKNNVSRLSELLSYEKVKHAIKNRPFWLYTTHSLITALMDNRLDLFQMLLDAGWNINSYAVRPNGAFYNALHMAVRYKNKDAIGIILGKFYNTQVDLVGDLGDSRNGTALEIAGKVSDSDFQEWFESQLEDHGFSVSTIPNEKRNAISMGMPGASLHSTIKKYNLNKVREMIDNGWNIDAIRANDSGELLTPLLLAIRERNLAMAQMLVTKRANKDAPGFLEGKVVKPLEYAREREQEDMIKLLEKRWSIQQALPTYSPGKGYVLIIAMDKDRPGNDVDVNKLKETFGDLNCTIQDDLRNKSRNEIERGLKEIASRRDMKEYAYFFLFVLAHGGNWSSGNGSNNGSNVQSAHSLAMGTEYIVDINDDRIPTKTFKDFIVQLENMAGKPRGLFVQSCRGEKLEKLSAYESDSAKNNSGPSMGPLTSDCLFVFATMEDAKATRSADKGSPFIQRLCRAIHDWPQESFFNILLIVTNEVSSEIFRCEKTNEDYCQVPVFTSNLTKSLILSRK